MWSCINILEEHTVSIFQPRRWRQHFSPKHWNLPACPQSFTMQKPTLNLYSCSQLSANMPWWRQSLLFEVQSGLPTCHGDDTIPAVWGAVRAPTMTWGQRSPMMFRAVFWVVLPCK
jgi:hypothetical protein